MPSRRYTARAHSAFIHRYAKQAGISQHSAQRHRRENAPGWQAFVAALKVQTPQVPPAPPPEADEIERIDPADATPENMDACILHMWDSTNKAYWRAVAEGDLLGQCDLDAALRTISRGWRSAVKEKQRHDQFVRNHVPASEIAAVLGGFFVPLKSALEGMPTEAGPMTNPGNHEAGRQGCLEWRESRLLPALERVFEKLSDYAAA